MEPTLLKKGYYSGIFTACSLSIITEIKTYLRVRSSRSEVFCEKSALKNFAKFTGKHLCRCLF